MCEADAKDMYALAKKQGFPGEPADPDQEGDRERGRGAPSGDAAKKLSKGDLLFVTYSGHGGQVQDTNSDDEGRQGRDLGALRPQARR